MSYKIILTENAVEGILRLRKAGERQALKKIDRLLSELEEHPETGTGKPERLPKRIVREMVPTHYGASSSRL